MALKDDKSGPTTGPSKPPIKSAIQQRQRVREEEQEYKGTMFSISGIRSMSLHSTGTKIVMGLLIVIFAVGFGLSTIGTQNMANLNGGSGGMTDGPDPVADVGAEHIVRKDFLNAYKRELEMAGEFGQPSGVADLLGIQQRSLQELTDDSAQYQDAMAQGIKITDADIDKKITDDINDQIKQEEGDNPANFRRRIEQQYSSMQDYIDQQRPNYDRDKVSRQLAIDKLQKSVKDTVKLTEDDYKRSVTKLQLREIVIQPALPPANAPDMKAAQAKSDADAKTRADKIFAEAQAAITDAAFAALAQKESDDVTTKTKGGDLGLKAPNDLPVSTAIKDALMNSTGSLVGPAQDDVTKYWYIFFVASRKLDLPKDYDKKKADLIKSYQDQRGDEKWEAYKDKITKAAQVTILDPGLSAYKMQMEDIVKATPTDQATLRQQAIDLYGQALKYSGGEQAAALYYQMAQLYAQMNVPDKQLQALQQSVGKYDTDPDTHIEYATALIAAKKNDDALNQLKLASKELDTNPSQPSMFGGNPDDARHERIAGELDELKQPQLAADERSKVKPPQQPPGGGMGGMGGMGGLQIK